MAKTYLANALLQSQKYQEAHDAYEQIIQLALDQDNSEELYGLYLYYGICLQELGQKQKAKEIFQKGYQLSLGLDQNFANEYIVRMSIYEPLDSADSNIKKLENIASNATDAITKKNAYASLQVLHEKKNRLKKALMYAEEQSKLSEILYSDEIKNIAITNEIKIKYEKELFEQKCELDQKDINIEKLNLANSRKKVIAWSISIISALIIILILIALKRRKEHAMKLAAEKRQLEKLNEAKNNELVEIIKSDAEKNRLLSKMQEQLESAKEDQIKTDILIGVKNQIKIALKDDSKWESFQNKFEMTHNNFLQKLTSKHPDLTQQEKKLCSLIKMDLSNLEISDALHIESASLRVAKSRLKKKLKTDVSLSNYILSL